MKINRNRIFVGYLGIFLSLFIGCSGGSKDTRGGTTTPPTSSPAGKDPADEDPPEEEPEQPPAAPGPGEGGNPPESPIKGNRSK